MSSTAAPLSVPQVLQVSKQPWANNKRATINTHKSLGGFATLAETLHPVAGLPYSSFNLLKL